MSLILAGNWKLNKSPKEAEAFAKEFLQKTSQSLQSQTLIFPSAISFVSVSEAFESSSIGFGFQNIATQDSGAYTGENSAAMSKELGATHVLIGHSERRKLYAETNKDVNEKIQLALKNYLVPVICIGETLEERQKNITNDVLKRQLKEGLEGIQFTSAPIIAYEPVWAIGTGEVATPEQANSAHECIKSYLPELISSEIANKIKVLYGGSVKPANAKELGAQKNIDGFLVGGASLKVESFLGIGEHCV